MGSSRRAPGRSERPSEPRLTAIEPTDLGLRGEDEGIDHEQPGKIPVVSPLLESRVVAQRPQRGGALPLDEPLDVDAGHGDRERELDR